MSARFDEYRDSYRDEVEKSISFVGRDLDFFTQAKARALLDLVRRELGDPAGVRALDVGCGPGETDAYLAPHVGDIQGIDVSEGVLEAARLRNPGVEYTVYDGETLPFEDGRFDLAFAICVVHHVAPARWGAFTAELGRVVRPGGVVAIVEHNPYNPLTRLAVHRCEFDDDAVLLSRGTAEQLVRSAGLIPIDSRYILFFPWRNDVLGRLERHLRRVPLGAQYVNAARRV